MRRALAIAAGAAALCALVALADARPGGGQSYSGGSSGGDGGGIGELVHLLIRLIIYWPEVGIPVTIVVVIGVIYARRRNDGLGDWDSGESIATRAPPPSLAGIRRFDPQFSEVVFSDFAYALYARAHVARNAGDNLRALAPYATPAVRSELEHRQPPPPVHGVIVGAMRPTVVQLPPSATDAAGHPMHVRVGLHFEANLTVGDPSAWRTLYVHENWVLQRDATVASKPPDKAATFACPNCAAAFETSDEVTCSYCGEAITAGRFDWTVISVAELHQESRPPKLARHAAERGTSLATVQHPRVNDEIARLAADDPAVTLDSFGARLHLIHRELTTAWSALELTRARPYVSDHLYNYLMYWVKAYQQQGLRNIVDDPGIVQWTIAKITRDAHYDAITVRVWATGKDYTVDQSGAVVGGSKSMPRPYTEYWTLIRGAAVRGGPRDDKTCPNCAADLNISMAGTCEYCGAHVTSGEFDWVLSKIEQDEAYTG